MGKSEYRLVEHPNGKKGIAKGRTRLNLSKVGYIKEVYPEVNLRNVTTNTLANRLRVLKWNTLRDITGKKQSKMMILKHVDGLSANKQEEVLKRLNKAAGKHLLSLPFPNSNNNR